MGTSWELMQTQRQEPPKWLLQKKAAKLRISFPGRKTWFEARNKKLKHLMNSKLTLTWGHWLVGIHCSVVHWPMTITASKSYVLVLVLLWVQILPSRNCFRISHCVGHSKMEDGQSLFSEVQGLLAEREWPKRLLLSFDLCNMMRLKHHQKERIRFSA